MSIYVKNLLLLIISVVIEASTRNDTMMPRIISNTTPSSLNESVTPFISSSTSSTTQMRSMWPEHRGEKTFMDAIKIENSNDCCWEITISSSGAAKSSKQNIMLGNYTKADKNHNNRIAYYKSYNINGTFKKSHLIFHDKKLRWEINRNRTDVWSPPTLLFPCNVMCPEDCHNNSHFEYWHKKKMHKDDKLLLTCRPADCEWGEWSQWVCSEQDCRHNTRNRTFKHGTINDPYCRKNSIQTLDFYSSGNGWKLAAFVVGFGLLLGLILSGIGLYYKRKQLLRPCFNYEDDESYDDDYNDDYTYDAVYQRNSRLNDLNNQNRQNRNTDNLQDDTIETHEDDGEVVTKTQNPYYSDGYDSNQTIRLEVVQQSKNVYYGT